MSTYMLMFIDDPDQWDKTPKEQKDAKYAEIGKWWGDLTAKGVIKSGEELMNKNTATTVRRVNGQMKVSDGPFIESKEHVGGYALIEVPDLDAAITVAKSWPGSDVEVRPIVER
jgi:hypothetical protein